jgi:hypothetical protein
MTLWSFLLPFLFFPIFNIRREYRNKNGGKLFIRHLFVYCHQFCLLLEIIVKTTAVTIQSIEKFLNGVLFDFLFWAAARKRRRDPCCLSVITWFIHPRLQAADSPCDQTWDHSVPFVPQLGPVSSASVWPLLQFKLLAVVSSPAPLGRLDL